MFSPETYALLINKITANASDISELETSVGELGTGVETLGTNKADKIPVTAPTSAIFTRLENMYSAATDKTIVNSVTTASSNVYGLFGLKATGSNTNVFFFWQNYLLYLAFRVVSGESGEDVTWNLYSLSSING